MDALDAFELYFRPKTFDPMATIDNVFNKYGIEFASKPLRNNRGRPEWKITVKNSRLAEMSGVEEGAKWNNRRRGVTMENDLFTERFATEFDVDGKPVLPDNFKHVGDPTANTGRGRELLVSSWQQMPRKTRLDFKTRFGHRLWANSSPAGR